MEKAAIDVNVAVAIKPALEYDTESQTVFGKVLVVHVIPSVEEAALLSLFTVTKTPFPNAIAFEPATVVVRKVQVIPSVEEAAVVELLVIATKTPLP